MKKITILFLLLFVSLSCFASVLNPYESRKISTDHFDIIYSTHCEDTASRIYENCEDIYKDLTQIIGTDPDIRIPVIITDKYKLNNAYFTSYPYNILVLYDQISVSEELSVFEDSILSIFRHELTHALLNNIRGKIPLFLSNIFGDYISTSSALYVDRFFSEGISVYSESRYGSGRLNNSHVMEIVRQAKADGSFPSWDVVNGSRDTYGSGTLSYIFGGAFMKFLSDTYGEDTLFEYFRQAGDFHMFKLSHELFISVFNTTPKAAWKAFEQSIKVPEKVYENQALSLASFKSAQAFECSSYSNSYFYTCSSNSGDIYRISADSHTVEKTGSESSNYKSLDVARDGRILVSHDLNEKSNMVLLDSTGKEILSFAEGSVIGCLAYLGNDLKAVVYSADGQMGKLTFYALEDNGKKLTATPEKEIILGYDTTILSMESSDTGYLVLLLRKGLERDIVYINLKDMSMKAFKAGQDILINDISCIKGTESIVYSFSSSDPSHPSLSRLGRADIDLATNSAVVYESTIDISGGVYEPASDGQKVFYISRFLYEDKPCLADISTFALKYATTATTVDITIGEEKESEALEILHTDSEKYRMTENIKRGTIYPFAANPLDDNAVSPGLSYFTADLTQSLELMATAGYGYKDNMAFLKASATNSSLPVTLTVTGNIFIPVKDISNTEYLLQATAEKVFTFNRDSQKITLTDTASLRYTDSIAFSNIFRANYHYSKNTGLGHYDYTSHLVTLTLSKESTELSAYYTMQPILPFNCPGKLTYNLPLTLTGLVLHYNENSWTYLAFGAETTLFAWEIQDNFPYTLFYFKRLHLDASFQHVIRYAPDKDTATANVLKAGLFFEFCPVVGRSLSEINIQAGPLATWNLRNEKPQWSFVFKITQ